MKNTADLPTRDLTGVGDSTAARKTSPLRVRRASGPRRPWLPTVLLLGIVGTFLVMIAMPNANASDPTGPRPVLAIPPLSGLSCNGGSWNSTHLVVWGSGCQAVYGVEWVQNLSNWNASNQFNFSFSIPYVAELNGSGGVQRMANFLAPVSGVTNVTSTASEVSISNRLTANVTNASGGWAPNDYWGGGGGPTWSVSNSSVGTSSMTTVFHLLHLPANRSANATRNGTYGVKFDVDVSGWPWAAPADSLGIVVEALAAGGAHFTYNATSGALAERWNTTGQAYASLIFGNVIDVVHPGTGTGRGAVSSDVGLFYAGSPNRLAVSMLTFTGVPGDYSLVSYDPWVSFSPIPPSENPSGPTASGGAGLATWEISAIVAGVAAAVIVGVVASRRRLRREGGELVRGIRKMIDDGGEPPGPPRE